MKWVKKELISSGNMVLGGLPFALSAVFFGHLLEGER